MSPKRKGSRVSKSATVLTPYQKTKQRHASKLANLQTAYLQQIDALKAANVAAEARIGEEIAKVQRVYEDLSIHRKAEVEEGVYKAAERYVRAVTLVPHNPRELQLASNGLVQALAVDIHTPECVSVHLLQHKEQAPKEQTSTSMVATAPRETDGASETPRANELALADRMLAILRNGLKAMQSRDDASTERALIDMINGLTTLIGEASSTSDGVSSPGR